MNWEGWNIGSVSIRRVRLSENQVVFAQSKRHSGDLAGTIRFLLSEMPEPECGLDGACLTGPLAGTVFTLPYLPEPLCIEKAIQDLNLFPDIVLSLGGETFVVYCIHEGRVRSMTCSSRCAGGSGEFLLQQFGRMGLDLETGLAEAGQGKRVAMASRCSVHIKSDATHKLNKGECSPADIAITMIADLATKIHALLN